MITCAAGPDRVSSKTEGPDNAARAEPASCSTRSLGVSFLFNCISCHRHKIASSKRKQSTVDISCEKEVELASVALKLNAISSDFIDDEYLSESDFTEEDSD